MIHPLFVTLVATAVVASLSWTPVEAGPNHYTCTIKAVYRVSADGQLAPRGPSLLNAQVGATFTVDRDTGTVIGDEEQSVTRGTLRASQVVVHDRGSTHTPFSLSWQFPNDVYVLHVLEPDPGVGKPFVFAGALEVVTGTCR
jgi:hypothetical protein